MSRIAARHGEHLDKVTSGMTLKWRVTTEWQGGAVTTDFFFYRHDAREMVKASRREPRIVEASASRVR